MRTVERDIVSALIFSKDGKLLQGMKEPKGGGVYDDSWHIPGGGVNTGENFTRALVREIKEEVGIDISPYKIELVDDIGRGESEKVLKETGERVMCKMKFYVYKIQFDKNADEISVNLADDLKEHRWFDIGELKNFKLAPPSVALFRRQGYL